MKTMQVLMVATLSTATLSPLTVHAEDVHRTVPARGDGDVRIVNVAGEIRVSGWDREEVDVRAELGGGVERLDVIEESNGVEVKVVLPKFGVGNKSADLVVRVPEDSRVEISAVSADVSVDDLKGDVRIKLVSGDVSARVGGEELEVAAVSGDISLSGDDGSGRVRVRTVSGDVRVTDYSGDVEASSVSGDVGVILDSVGDARLSTTSGDLRLSGDLQSGARIEAESVSGDVVLDLEAEGRSNVDIETHSGDIGGCYSDQVQRKGKHGPGKFLRLQGDPDGADVRVKTVSGDSSFCDH